MKDPLPLKKGSSQMNIRTELRYFLVLSLKDPTPGSPIRVSGEAGEPMNWPSGLGWRHPTKTRKFPET